MEIPAGFNQAHAAKSPYTICQEVAWGEMDALGHVNNIYYLRWFENVRFHYFERTGINALHREAKVGPILAKSDCQYFAPIEFPDQLWISTRVARIGNSSFTMENRVYSEHKRKICAQGNAIIVMVDYNAGTQPTRVPEEIRAAIRAIEGDGLEEA